MSTAALPSAPGICDPLTGPAAVTGVDRTNARRWAIGLAVLFFIFHLPTLPSLSRWRGDERFYTDAAVQMMQKGNYLLPEYEDGAPRFRKPILTYWAVVAGYKVFGFNYLGSRFLFLCAGALTIWLAFELCLLLSGKQGYALVAAAMFASNYTVHHTSIRSTPDMLLCLFLLASLLGFAGLIFRGRHTKWYLLAYFGTALAVGVKGFAGILAVLYAFLYCRLRRSHGLRVRHLLHPWILPTALLLASAWYIWAFFQHGDAAARDFLQDQVGSRLSGNKLYILENAAVYFLEFFRQLLPWSFAAVFVAALDWRGAADGLREERAWLWFALGWILLFYVVFVPGNIQRTRYFLPVYPVLALVFTTVLLRYIGSRSEPIPATRTLWVFYVLAGMAGALLAVVGSVLAGSVVICGLIVLGSSAAAWRLGRGLVIPQKLALASGFLVLLLALNLLLIVPVFVLSPAPGIVKFCSSTPLVRRKAAVPMCGIDTGWASQIRALSGGAFVPRLVRPEECDGALRGDGYVICSEKVLKEWSPSGARVQECGTGSAPWKGRDYLGLLRSGAAQSVREALKTKFFFVSVGG